MSHIHFFTIWATITTLLFSIAVEPTAAVTYQVINNAGNTDGGARFDKEIGSSYANQVLATSSDFIWNTFQQPPNTRKSDVDQVTLYVDSYQGVAYTAGNEIHLSSGYVGGFSGDVRGEVTGVLYHEMTHVWQWNGAGRANGGLIEGIADYVRLKAGYGPAHWVQPGQGDRWDQGYDVTARFLDYCDSLRSGFVAELNNKMMNDYNDSFFNDLLGKSVDQLWMDYKAKYNN